MLSTRKSFIWYSPGIRVGLEGVVTSLTGAKSDNLVEAVAGRDVTARVLE